MVTTRAVMRIVELHFDKIVRTPAQLAAVHFDRIIRAETAAQVRIAQKDCDAVARGYIERLKVTKQAFEDAAEPDKEHALQVWEQTAREYLEFTGEWKALWHDARELRPPKLPRKKKP